MKRFASVLVALASSAFVLPVAFPHVVAGCNDSAYVFGNSAEGGPNEQSGVAAAALAKSSFCEAAKVTGAL